MQSTYQGIKKMNVKRRIKVNFNVNGVVRDDHYAAKLESSSLYRPYKCVYECVKMKFFE